MSVVNIICLLERENSVIITHMNRKLVRRIIAWFGVVFAVAFAPLMVLNFYDFGGSANSLIDAFLWTALAGAVICFGLTRFIIVDKPSDFAFGDAGETDNGESNIDDGDNDVPNGEGNENRENEDDGGGD